MKSFWRIFILFRGRISRTAFWWAGLAACAVFVLLFVFLENVLGRASTLVLYPPLVWVLAALAVKRLHDRGRSSWRLLLVLIPVVGPLWLFVSLVLRSGTPGENQYGEDPRLFGLDYLRVK